MNKAIKNAVFAVSATMLALMPATTMAQDEVEASVGADIVSGYIWRGQDLGGVSIQPSLSVGYKGLSLTAWGSAGIDKEDAKELDLTLSYTTGGLSFGVTDYYFTGGPGYLHYGSHKTMHTFEGQVGYDFGPLAVNWYTNFAGKDGYNKDGKRAYSSYLSLTAPFSLGGLEWKAQVGATPWATTFYNEEIGGSNGFAVCEISLEAEKEIKITDSFTLPAFARVTLNPRAEGTFFDFGVSF